MSDDRCIKDTWDLLRTKIIHRDNGECQVCGHQAKGYQGPSDKNPEGVIPTYHYQVHHLEQVSVGGEDDDGNLVTLCPKHHDYVHNRRCSNYVSKKTRRRLQENLNL